MPGGIGEGSPKAFISHIRDVVGKKAVEIGKKASYLGKNISKFKGDSKTNDVALNSFQSQHVETARVPDNSKMTLDQMIGLIEKCSMSNLQGMPRRELDNLNNEVNNFIKEHPDMGENLSKSVGNIGKVIMHRGMAQQKIDEKCNYNLDSFEGKRFLSKNGKPGDMLIRQSSVSTAEQKIYSFAVKKDDGSILEGRFRIDTEGRFVIPTESRLVYRSGMESLKALVGAKNIAEPLPNYFTKACHSKRTESAEKILTTGKHKDAPAGTALICGGVENGHLVGNLDESTGQRDGQFRVAVKQEDGSVKFYKFAALPGKQFKDNKGNYFEGFRDLGKLTEATQFIGTDGYVFNTGHVRLSQYTPKTLLEKQDEFVGEIKENLFDPDGNLTPSNLNSAKKAVSQFHKNEQVLKDFLSDLRKQLIDLESRETDLLVQEEGGKEFVPKKGAEEEVKKLRANMGEIESLRLKAENALESFIRVRSDLEAEIMNIETEKEEAARKVDKSSIQEDTQNALKKLDEYAGLIEKFNATRKKEVALIKKRLKRAAALTDPKEIEQARLGANKMINLVFHPDKAPESMADRTDAQDKAIQDQFAELFKALHYET